MSERKPIGEILVSTGDIDDKDLSEALSSQQSLHARVGEILLSSNKVSPQRFYNEIANQHDLPFVDLEETPPDSHLVAYEELMYYQSYRCIPWKLQNGRMVIACTELTARLQHWARHFYHKEVTFVVTTPRDIRRSIEKIFGQDISLETRTKLLNINPSLSAYTTLTKTQRFILIGLLALSFAALWFEPRLTLIYTLTFVNCFYFATIIFKFLLLFRRKDSVNIDDATLESLSDGDLPIYTILAPMYKEEASIPNLLEAIRNLNYPKTKLDVKLVVEEDDEMTINAIKALKPEPYFDIIRVPPSEPRTKPKACNYALAFAKGDIVTIYDVEDQPEPNQLKKVVAAYKQCDPSVICFQARLNYFNWNESMITKLFAIEYSSLFDIMLPGLDRLKIPIPLGGTSNHINLRRLRDLGDWDPYNVTEDADLGMRLAVNGFRTEVLDSVTLEEAPITFIPWLKQRTRWIKGYMQTWLVYMRNPGILHKALKTKGFIGFQLFIGGPCFVFVFSPLLWVLAGVWIAGYIPMDDVPPWLYQSCYAVLFLGIFCHLIYALAAAKKWSHSWRSTSIAPAILMFPFYWLLHSIASLRALWQLVFKPHYWDKTTHGVTRINAHNNG
ncbi:MAG: glycosyltransferase [Rickettsiales bacterium]|nr:glycosyltransferase [Rickettsiales bacterium]